jgi:hypothetical protein
MISFVQSTLILVEMVNLTERTPTEYSYIIKALKENHK